jgi:hypothetical protein
MRKAIALLAVILFLTASLHAQIIQYEVSVKYSTTASGTTADITVTVKAGTPDYTYYLTTNDPLKGEVLMQSDPIRKRSYVFKGVKPGKYFLKIVDSTGNQAGKTVNVTDDQL